VDFVNWLKIERQRVAAWTSIAVGGICLLAGWIGVSGTKETYEQITYVVSGGIASLFFLGLGVGLLVSADLHDEWRKMDRLEQTLGGLPAVPGEARGSGSPGGAGPGEVEEVTVDLRGATVMAASPLRRLDAGITGFGVALALVLLVAGWFRASGTLQARTALDGALIATAALVVVGLSMAGYSLRMGRALGIRKQLAFAGLFAAAGTDATARPETGSDELFVAEGGVRFHRAGCAILTRRATVPYEPSQHSNAVACELCDAR
jgi:hypothetical protein